MIPDAQTNNISYANSIVFPYRSEHIPVTFVWILYSCLEKLIRKEVQRAHKDHSGIVASLKTSNQQCVCADSMGELHTHWVIHLYSLRSGGLKQFFSCHSKQLLSQHNFDATSDTFCRNKHVFVVTKLPSLQKRYWWQLLPMTVESLMKDHPEL